MEVADIIENRKRPKMLTKDHNAEMAYESVAVDGNLH